MFDPNRPRSLPVEPLGKLPIKFGEVKRTALLQNYPNPFNPETWIPYSIGETANVAISIHDAKGGLVRQLDLGRQAAGTYLTKEQAAYWDGRDSHGQLVSSGVYFYRLDAGGDSDMRKMVVVK